MNFDEFDFSDEIKQAIKQMKYDSATSVQMDTIPLMLAGHNVIVKSHTGSGKTAAFGIPISEKIFKGESRGALVLCPTRELAVQVKDELREINYRTRLKVSAFYGGHGMGAELKDAERGVDILCATPGRLLDHFRSHSLKPGMFDTIVLDEADRMLDMGFINDLKEILDYVKPKKTHLFSATLDGSIANIISEYIPTYEEILMEEELVGKSIFERHIKVNQDEKIPALEEILKEAKDSRVLVFVGTKRKADYLARSLHKAGHHVETIHGDKSQRAREFALRNFKTGKCRILIGTDVAARGLQVDNIEFVINFDPADSWDTHKHRIGRTGRMGDTGHAITFLGPDGAVIEPKKMFQKRSGQSGGRGSFGGGRGGFRGGGRGQRGFARSPHGGRGFSDRGPRGGRGGRGFQGRRDSDRGDGDSFRGRRDSPSYY